SVCCEGSEGSAHLRCEAEALFKMLRTPKRDVFESLARKQIRLDDMPAGVVFDVLVVPGSEQLSAFLTEEAAGQDEEEEKKEHSLLDCWHDGRRRREEKSVVLT